MKKITREQFEAMLRAGRLLVWATLYERQDYKIDFGRGYIRVVRDVTNEPSQHNRKLIGRSS